MRFDVRPVHAHLPESAGVVERDLVVIEVAEHVSGLSGRQYALRRIHIREVDADAHGGAGENAVVDLLLEFELVLAQGVLGGGQADRLGVRVGWRIRRINTIAIGWGESIVERAMREGVAEEKRRRPKEIA